MNDLDSVTFAAFARRFSRIEQWVPDQTQAGFTAVPDRRSHGAFGRLAVAIGVVLLLGAALAFFSLGSWPAPLTSPSPTASRPAVTLPPDSAGPEVVLSAYLSALVARDCDAADQFIDSPTYRWSDMLCGGAVNITDFSLVGEPQREGYNRARLDALLTTDGRSIGLPADQGRFTFDLWQRTSGAWRIIDAYPWPITLFPTRPPT